MLAVLTSYHDAYFRQQEEILAFVAWVALGLAAGFTGSQLTKPLDKNIIPDLFLGLAGALAGGWLLYHFGPLSPDGFNLGSYFAALGASVSVLLIYYGVKNLLR